MIRRSALVKSCSPEFDPVQIFRQMNPDSSEVEICLMLENISEKELESIQESRCRLFRSRVQDLAQKYSDRYHIPQFLNRIDSENQTEEMKFWVNSPAVYGTIFYLR